MRFFCELCGGPNDSVGRCLRRCEAESRGPRRSAYTSAEMAAYNAGAAAGYKQAEARIRELEAEIARVKAEKIVELCVCVNGDNPPPDCPCVICTVRRAEAHIKELEAQLASERRETERLRAVYNRSTSCDIARERDEAEARIRELEEQAERCECDKHDWEKAEARIRELEAECMAHHNRTAMVALGTEHFDHGPDEPSCVRCRLEAAEARLQAVKALHCEDGEPTTNDYGVQHWCVCGEHYPCPTLRAAEGKP